MTPICYIKSVEQSKTLIKICVPEYIFAAKIFPRARRLSTKTVNLFTKTCAYSIQFSSTFLEIGENCINPSNSRMD